MHGTRLRIKRSVMDSGCFVDFRRITRKFVPKTIKINAFTASHQPFSIGTAEREMPERRATHDFLPRRNARHRRIHHHQPVGFIGVTAGIGICNRCANVMPDDRNTIDTELSKNGPDIGCLCFLIIATGGMGGKSHAAQVWHDHSVVACKLGSHRRPNIACISKSVKQHDRRALSADSDMNCRAVGLNLLSLEVGRKYGLSTCVGSIERGEECVGSLDDYGGYLLWFG